MAAVWKIGGGRGPVQRPPARWRLIAHCAFQSSGLPRFLALRDIHLSGRVLIKVLFVVPADL